MNEWMLCDGSAIFSVFLRNRTEDVNQIMNVRMWKREMRQQGMGKREQWGAGEQRATEGRGPKAMAW